MPHLRRTRDFEFPILQGRTVRLRETREGEDWPHTLVGEGKGAGVDGVLRGQFTPGARYLGHNRTDRRSTKAKKTGRPTPLTWERGPGALPLTHRSRPPHDPARQKRNRLC
jgi:hypothetical protein